MALQFPLDISEDTKYEAKVSFQPIKLRTIDVAGLFAAAGGGNINQTTTETPDGTQTVDRALDLESFRGESAPLGRIEGTGQAIESFGNSCTLYLPQAVQIADRASYGNVNLGVLGASTSAGLEKGGSILAGLGDAITNPESGVRSMIDAVLNGTSGSKEVGRLAISRASGILGEKVSGAVRSNTRTTVNPNTRALFEQVPLREFAFNFKMIPSSRKEVQMIKSIVNFFRSEIYPEVIEVANIPAGYEFPNVFQIKMFYKDQSKPLATRILPSYLTGFSATYNGQSQAMFEGGDFTEVDISMQFIESSALNKELVRKGF